MTVFNIIFFLLSPSLYFVMYGCVLSVTPLFSYLSPQTRPDVAEEPLLSPALLEVSPC